MKFVFYLLKRYKTLLLIASLVGMVSGAANAKLLALVNEQISAGGDKGSFTFFVLLGSATVLAGIVSEVILIFLSQKITYYLRLKMGHQILDLPMRQLEMAGGSKLVATFANDIGTISRTLMGMPGFLINATVVIGCMIYLGYLTVQVLMFMLGFIVLSASSYIIPEKVAIRYMRENREAWDSLFSEFNAMNRGAKELRLHHRRRLDFFHTVFKQSANKVRTTYNVQQVIYAIINNWGNFIYFAFMGILIYILPHYYSLSPTALVGFVLISLYIFRPIVAMINTVPMFRNANIAFEKIRSLGLNMLDDDNDKHLRIRPDPVQALPQLSTLELVGVQHSFYREREERDFILGPIGFKVNAGELIFIIGGNGSGKTTLAKLLTGLYVPENGMIKVNGRPIDDENREAYRQYFSAIFDDFHIFEQFLGIKGERLDQNADHFLKALHLDHKVTIKEGRLSTTELSTGQRKRLALLTVYLEDRPVYLFDEWAADQDPEFKRVFYYQLLPALKARGKTVFVISHDDRYFDVADHIVKLADGQLELDEKPG